MRPTSNYLRCEGRELHYTEWASAHGSDADVVIAWHGYARTGRDMDDIAEHLAQSYRVICPDTIGRGLSQWSPTPAIDYTLPFYVRLAASLVEQLGLRRFHWLGTSMGGAIGVLAAATTLKGRVRRLVINDIGPRPAQKAIERILAYASRPPVFGCIGELEAYFRTVYAPYGHLSDAQWRRLTETSLRRLPDGRWTAHYDPAIVTQLQSVSPEGLWPAWDSLDLPVLCLRGAHSDLLLPEEAEQMRSRGPLAVVVEIQGCGHAPALNTPEQFALVERFLGGESRVSEG
jgi:pimeloyl-ACP methyl ester carboxylesterase